MEDARIDDVTNDDSTAEANAHEQGSNLNEVEIPVSEGSEVNVNPEPEAGSELDVRKIVERLRELETYHKEMEQVCRRELGQPFNAIAHDGYADTCMLAALALNNL